MPHEKAIGSVKLHGSLPGRERAQPLLWGHAYLSAVGATLRNSCQHDPSNSPQDEIRKCYRIVSQVRHFCDRIAVSSFGNRKELDDVS
jgi:hypothetical protein